jgi:MFS family permease
VTLQQRLPALAYPEYRIYLSGGFVSNVGNMVQSAAVAWHIWTLTNSSLMVGMLGLVRVGPLLIFSLFGGVVADQADRRKVMLVTQTGMAAVAAALFLMQAGGFATVSLIYLLVGAGAIARAFDGPARNSVVPNLVPEHTLANALSLNGTSWRLSDVLGPIIAGVLIASLPYGIAACYLFNFATFFAMLYAIWRLGPLPPKGIDETRVKTFRGTLAFIREGIVFVRKTPVVRSAMWIDFWATFFSAADALLPAFATMLDLGPQGYGILAASSGMGALLAAVVMSLKPMIKNHGRWVIGMIACYGLFTILFGLSQNLIMAVLFLAATGAADMVSTVLRQTIRQLATPDNMRGRMTATGMLFHISGPQLGDLESGVAARFFGERLAVVLGGGACVLIAALWTRSPVLRDYVLPAREDPPK